MLACVGNELLQLAFWICLLTDCCVSAKFPSSYAGHGICPGYDGAHVVVNPMKMRKGSFVEPGRVHTNFIFGQMIRIAMFRIISNSARVLSLN
jgi:hypothetical protein